MLSRSIRLAHRCASKISTRSLSTQDQPTLRDFLKADKSPNETKRTRRPQSGVTKHTEILCNCDSPTELKVCSKSAKCQYRVNGVPVFIRTYGCQMNENDTSIVASILEDYGYKLVPDDSSAEIQLLMTCAIRESAESKIWVKLRELNRHKNDPEHPLKQIGLLGCMAERLKQKLLETTNSVDIVAGPDAYRDLPRLFSINRLSNEKAINCLLSFDETYSDIRPVTNINDVTSFISITRGCDNLCSYCIVPFTRGRERSRPLPTIIDEVKHLMSKGIKEVTLLGQNVNSYRDLSTPPEDIERADLFDLSKTKENPADGFKTVYKPRVRGLTFDILLEEAAKISPELRIRFTSPHPKDFTDAVIEVMRKYKNIARCIHLPAQSGSDSILERMRRGYTKKAYLDLVGRLRTAIPDLAITSDFITGFCGETDQDHAETIDLIKTVKYNFIYVFPYSEREKTNAFHKLNDDVPHQVKVDRVKDIHTLFRDQAAQINRNLIGSVQLVLVESDSLRSQHDWQGRTDSNVKTIIPKAVVLDTRDNNKRAIRAGDYVACEVIDSNSQTLKAVPLFLTSQDNFFRTSAKDGLINSSKNQTQLNI